MKKNPLKMLWLAAAFLCLGIGAVGVILPIYRQHHSCWWHLFVLQEDRKDFTSGFWGRNFTKIIWTAL